MFCKTLPVADGLTPSNPKKANIRQGIAAKGNREASVAVTPKANSGQDIKRRAGKQGPESHLCATLGGFVSPNADLSAVALVGRPAHHRAHHALKVADMSFVRGRDDGMA